MNQQRFAGTVTSVAKNGRRFHARRDGDGLLVQFFWHRAGWPQRGDRVAFTIGHEIAGVIAYGRDAVVTVRPYRPAPAGKTKAEPPYYRALGPSVRVGVWPTGRR